MMMRSLVLIALYVLPCCVLAPSSLYAQPKDTRSALRSEIGKGTQEPLFISSNTLSANSDKRVFTYEGNVTMHRGDVVITANRLLGMYDENNRVDKIICEKNVVITRGEQMRASGDHAEYDVRNEIMELTENPELSQQGNVLTADKVIFYAAENRSEAVGNVRVKIIRDEASKISIGALSGSDESTVEGRAEP